jgi:ribose transport system ATP-binding protein
MGNKANYIIETRDVTKVFPGVVALRNVSIGFKSGEVHAIVGENGAGKSTLIKLFSGALKPTQGSIYFEGKELTSLNPIKAIDAGIRVIYQELNMFPALSIKANLFMGKEIKRGIFLNEAEMYCRAKENLKKLGFSIDPNTIVRNLSVAYQQVIEICKSISSNLKVLILDEPTAPLSNNEVKNLFELIQKLKNQGLCIIYISHRIEEIFLIADTVSVMRDGECISTKKVNETNRNEIIRLMVGREISDVYPIKSNKVGETVLEVKNINRGKIIKDISFNLNRGEILGISGLVGSGRTELVRAIFGADRKDSGQIFINGSRVIINSPRDAIKKKVALIPEDRKQHGLILHASIIHNITIVSLKKFCKVGIENKLYEKKEVNEFKNKLNIKMSDPIQLVHNLSGGNQQKIVLAKWLSTDCQIIIFDEPTRGIDVNAKHEIYKIMNELADAGKSIIMISSELPEIIGMSDRIIVIGQGRVTGELRRNEFNQERIMELATSSS